MPKQRKSLYSTRVPIIRKPTHDVHPDLFLVIKDGKLLISGLNEKAATKPLIRLLDDLLYELKLIHRSKDANHTVRK
jgi:hypothetical protein